MRRINNLYQQACSFENLLCAFYKAKKGSGNSPESARFGFRLEAAVFELQDLLLRNVYQPSPYRYFTISDPKKREIAVAPFIDRVVHHAVVNIMEPLYEKCFIHDSYATRKGKGQHKAVFRAQQFARINNWYFKSDIQKYFASINHDILFKLIERKIKDKKLLSLLRQIISNGGTNGVGLPIGNLTSQFFANVYLNPFDHFVKQELKTKYYIRYMDDFVSLHNQKPALIKFREQAKNYLGKNLKLELKEKATFINKTLNGVPFLGARVFGSTVRIHSQNLKRYVKKIRNLEKEYMAGNIAEDNFYASMNSYCALFSMYNTNSLRKYIFLQEGNRY